MAEADKIIGAKEETAYDDWRVGRLDVIPANSFRFTPLQADVPTHVAPIDQLTDSGKNSDFLD